MRDKRAHRSVPDLSVRFFPFREQTPRRIFKEIPATNCGFNPAIQQKEYNISITKEDQPDLFDVENFYQNRVGNLWVALDGEIVVGTVALLDIQNHRVALRKMFVAKEYREKVFGTASLLLDNALKWAKQKGISEIYLGTTLQFLAAHRFYEKNGFEEIPQQSLPASFPLMQVDKKFYRLMLH